MNGGSNNYTAVKDTDELFENNKDLVVKVIILNK